LIEFAIAWGIICIPITLGALATGIIETIRERRVR
jgi:hypothetical protein